MGNRTISWMFVGVFSAVDLAWASMVHLSIVGWWKALLASILLLALALAYRRRSPPISNMAEVAAWWITFTASGAVLTFLCATWRLPLRDEILTTLDQSLGFNWPAWRSGLSAVPAVQLVLKISYGLLLPQIIVAVLLFPAIGAVNKGRELSILAALTLLPTMLIFTLAPALGPFAIFGGQTAYLTQMLALRADGPWSFDLSAMEGIITMPSYHTILAILFTYAFRDTGAVGWGIALLNTIMLFSIPSIGGHYLMDMLAGASIAVLCILALRIASILTNSRQGRSS